MKTLRNLFSQTGNRKQAIVSDTEHTKEMMVMPPTLKFGRVRKVYTFDDSTQPPVNKTAAFITYQVVLMPEGTLIDNVPSCYSSGHYLDYITPNAPPLNQQNTEETPLIIGQTVLVGFVNNSNLNPIIICPVSCARNAGTQTAAQYPQKSETWQGTTRTIDKNGNVTYNIVTNENFTVQINGVNLLTVDGSTNTVNIGTGTEFGVLGNTLQTFLNSVFDVLTGHTHSGVSTGLGTSGPPVGVTVPTVTTTKLKVQ